MSPYVAAFVTTNDKEWDRPLCVEQTTADCKAYFCRWYANVDYDNCSVRYALVNIQEVE